MVESRISAGATEKVPGWEKPHAKTVAWSDGMEGHAQNCVERFRIDKREDGAIIQGFESLLR